MRPQRRRVVPCGVRSRGDHEHPCRLAADVGGREQVAERIAQGLTPAQIADDLKVAHSAVLSYLETAVGKGLVRRSDIYFTLRQGTRRSPMACPDGGPTEELGTRIRIRPICRLATHGSPGIGSRLQTLDLLQDVPNLGCGLRIRLVRGKRWDLLLGPTQTLP
jgi:DNA-binding CsgD family transcriptional regulator